MEKDKANEKLATICRSLQILKYFTMICNNLQALANEVVIAASRITWHYESHQETRGLP
jgi:hypothetical protein